MDVFILLVIFQVKHFICDYPLQVPYMLQKANKTGWAYPLFAHASVHALGTFIVVSFWDLKLATILMLADLILHFTVDRIKASPYMLNRYGPENKLFWWFLGLDQMTHHLINYLFIFIIVTKAG